MFAEPLDRRSFDLLPAHHREPVRTALLAVLDGSTLASLEPVTGGASGASVHRVDIEGSRSLLLRVETARDPFRDPHRSYVCLQAAADVGIAPAVHLADPDTGIVIMDFVHQRPLTEHPGGTAGVLRELAELQRRLQSTSPFPPMLDDFAALLGQMLAFIDGSGLFAPGVLGPVHDGFHRIGAAYPWDRDAQVSSHNDVNPFNVMFDGDRLWLIDWELAFRNDPFADIAGIANNFVDPVAQGNAAGTLVDALLHTWLGRAPDDSARRRLALMRQLNRLFYACLMLSSSVGRHPAEQDLHALTVDAFRAEVESGHLALGSPGLLHAMGKMQLAGFLAGMASDGFDDALREAGSG
jgi:aminoglycoside phosphotransferase (APT) family kinase protein